MSPTTILSMDSGTARHRRGSRFSTLLGRRPGRALGTTLGLIALALGSASTLFVVTSPARADEASASTAPRILAVATHKKVVRDSSGRSWSPARGFVGGRQWRTKPGTKIARTKDDVLYRTERVGMTRFHEPVADGTYKVTLRLAEIYWNAPGRRVFDVKAEGSPVLKDIDIFAAVGKNSAYDRSFRVKVTDGSLSLRFSSTASVPKVSAISIQRLARERGRAHRPVPSPTTTPKPAPTLTTAPTPAPTSKAPTTKAPTAAPTTKAPTAAPTTKAPTTSPPPPPAPTTPAPSVPPAPGLVKPGPGNTGVPAGTKLTPVYGNMRLTTPGATYDALDIHGFVVVAAPNVTITRSIVRGGVATANQGLITNYDPAATNFVIEDSELVPEHPSVWIDAIKGQNYTARRINAHGTNDAVKVHGDNVRVESSWLHDLVYRLEDPNLGNTPTHNDGVQVLGGKNIRIIGNTITGGHNAGLQVTQDYSATTDLQFNRNWVDGGGCSVNLAHKKLASMTGITVTQNRFGRNTRIADCAIISSAATVLSASGNVWDDNGQPVRIRNGG